MNSNCDLIPRNGINLAYEEFISQIDKEKISASQETMTRTQKRTLTTFLALCVTFGTPWDQAFMYLPVRFADTPYLIEQMNKDSQEKISQILSKEHKIERNWLTISIPIVPLKNWDTNVYCTSQDALPFVWRLLTFQGHSPEYTCYTSPKQKKLSWNRGLLAL